MDKFDLKLLDCTLRDGGYINDWKWGFQSAKDMISLLVRGKIDIVEVGFLRDVEEYCSDVTVCNHIEDLNRLLPDDIGKTMFSAMAMRSNYDISKLSDYSGYGIEMIRVTAHDYDIFEGLDFALEIKKKGYKLSINPINIMGYADDDILRILDKVNKIYPYQFSIVDTFGSMKRRDLDRIVSLVDNNLERNIRVAIHLHENMQLSCLLAQNFVDMHLNRPTGIDASLMGMGRSPGNLPIELIADYLNEYTDKAYDIDCLMDAIHDFVAPIKGESAWGYLPAYFLSAKYNLHRNYAEYYLGMEDLTNKDINHLLAGFDRGKCTAYDELYAKERYLEYKNNEINDQNDKEKLRSELIGRDILLLAPGESLRIRRSDIEDFIKQNRPTVISINFVPEDIKVDYAFFGNSRRYDRRVKAPCKYIITSNLYDGSADYCLNYNNLAVAYEQGFNSFVMACKLLCDIGVEQVYVGGADGCRSGEYSYYKDSMNGQIHTIKHNRDVARAIHSLGINVQYITPSEYMMEES